MSNQPQTQVPNSIPKWKQALVQWALSIDETPTSDPYEIACRLNPTLSGKHWGAAAETMATTEEVANEAIGLLEIL